MYGENQEEVFLGYSMGRQQNISEETAKTIDEEVRRLVHEAHDTARASSQSAAPISRRSPAA